MAPETQSAIRLTDPLPGLANGTWHTWALNWTPERLTFLFDDREIWSRTGTDLATRPVRHPELRGWSAFAGAIPPGGYGTRATSTTNMQVDYVRAWSTPATAPQSTSPPAVSGTAEVGSRADVLERAVVGGFQRPRSRTSGRSTGLRSPAHRGRPTPLSPATAAGRCRVASRRRASAAPPARRATRGGSRIRPRHHRCRRSARCRFRHLRPRSIAAPPGLLTGATSQRLGTSVAVSVFLPRRALPRRRDGEGHGPARRPSESRSYTSSAVQTIAQGATKTIRLGLSKRARTAIRRALRSRKRVTVRQSVRLTDIAGNARTLSRRVSLRLPPRG